MTTTISGTTITFNDSTTLTTKPPVSVVASDIGAVLCACVPGSSGLYCDYGGTVAGSVLTPAGMVSSSGTQQFYRGSTVSVGTWRCLGYASQSQGSGYRPFTAWVRVS